VAPKRGTRGVYLKRKHEKKGLCAPRTASRFDNRRARGLFYKFGQAPEKQVLPIDRTGLKRFIRRRRVGLKMMRCMRCLLLVLSFALASSFTVTRSVLPQLMEHRKRPYTNRLSSPPVCVRGSISTRIYSDSSVPKPVSAPLSRLEPRQDKLWERAAIYLLSAVVVRLLPRDLASEGKKLLRFDMTYKDFCDITKLLLRNSRSVDEVRKQIVGLLTSLMPMFVRNFFRNTMEKNPKLLCEQSSQWLGFGLLGWLIGPTEPIEVEVDVIAPGEKWQSGVKLLECRYLLESGCKSTCLHICKMPTQEFFNSLGVPLSMTPNFDDCSCKFEFGKAPLPTSLDEAFGQPCFLTCSLSASRGKNKELGYTKCS